MQTHHLQDGVRAPWASLIHADPWSRLRHISLGVGCQRLCQSAWSCHALRREVDGRWKLFLENFHLSPMANISNIQGTDDPYVEYGW